jgi:hypothetical protein
VESGRARRVPGSASGGEPFSNRRRPSTLGGALGVGAGLFSGATRLGTALPAGRLWGGVCGVGGGSGACSDEGTGRTGSRLTTSSGVLPRASK